MEFFLNYKKHIIICSAIMLVMLVVIISCINEGNSENAGDKNRIINTVVEADTEEMDDYLKSDINHTAIVEFEVSTEGQIQLYDADKKNSKVFTYTGITDIRDKFGKVYSVNRLKAGDIVKIGHDTASNELEYIHLDDEHWNINNIEE